MEWKSLAAEKSGTGAEREEEDGGMEGWMEMSGRVDNEEEREERMKSWLKICLYVPVHVCYQRL